MASIKNLKRDVHYAFGDIIDAVFLAELFSGKQGSPQGEEIVREAVDSFDTFMQKINDKKVADRGTFLKSVNKEFTKKVEELIEKVNAIN